jgi:aspartate racemase
MRTLGLIGGTGWISTVEYYRIINREVSRRLGGLESARILLHSVNYGDINRMNLKEDHPGVLALVESAALGLESIGAEAIVLCANTLHLYAEALRKNLSRPILHIAAAAAARIRERGLSRVGLLGTRYTMEKDFYTRQMGKEGLEVLVPGEADRALIHGAIYGELLKGEFRPETRSRFLDIVGALAARGAQGVVLGCTEIPLLLKQEDVDLPLFDTLEIHAQAAADFALSDTV